MLTYLTVYAFSLPVEDHIIEQLQAELDWRKLQESMIMSVDASLATVSAVSIFDGCSLICLLRRSRLSILPRLHCLWTISLISTRRNLIVKVLSISAYDDTRCRLFDNQQGT